MSSLYPEYRLGDLSLTDYPYSVRFGGDLGAPETVTDILVSLIGDGEIESRRRYGNREITLTVGIEGLDLLELAKYEAALDLECNKKANALTFVPGGGFAPASVFQTLTIDSKPIRNDDGWEQANYREWQLTIRALPHARSDGLTVVAPLAPPGSPVVTNIDTCASTTGWTGTRSGVSQPVVIFTDAGAVEVSEFDSLTTSPEAWTLTRTGSIDFTGTRYLVAQVRTLSPINKGVQCYVGSTATGIPMRLISSRQLDGSYQELVYELTGTVSALTFEHFSAIGEMWQGLLIRNLARTNVPPGESARQLSRSLEVRGTRRTPGSLRISSPDGTSPLGVMLVHTSPEDGSGYSPPLRRWRVSGNFSPTADANTYSGFREVIGTTAYVIYDIPTGSLPPGGYALMGFMRSSVVANQPLEVVVQSHAGAALGAEIPWSDTVNFPVANDWKLVPMGIYSLPTLSAKAGNLRVAMRTPFVTAVEYDELWLFKVDDDCALTVLFADAPYVWLDSADGVESQVPRVWEGAASDKSDAHYPRYGIYTTGNHVFPPPGVRVWTGARVDYPQNLLSYAKAWNTHAAEGPEDT